MQEGDHMKQPQSCCAPPRPTASGPGQRRPRPAPGRRARRGTGGDDTDNMIRLPGGSFLMGTDAADGFAADGEGPVHKVRLSPFFIDAAAVSNQQFGRFVADTGYQTEAEAFGWSFVFHLLLPAGSPPTRGIACAPWWRQVEGARWNAPEGPGSSIADRMDHPVIHVSWNDAVAFARWAGKRLPSEAEWEYAARGGLRQARFPWGDELTPGGRHRCNIWQGVFPRVNTCEDGFLGTAPAGSFEPNGFGLYNTSGNVWEWCADWFSQAAYQAARRVDPRGPTAGTERVIRGGSYLCHASYCNRYRVAARSRNQPASSTGNMGFRCARDA